MPPRALWIVPCLALFVLVMALPVSAWAVLWATTGAFAILAAGVATLLPRIGWELFAVNLAVYFIAIFAMTASARFREREWRVGFVHQRETRLLAERLRAQNESLAGLNRLRDEFIAGVLHDLRSPLTGIMLAAHLLRDSQIPTLEGRLKLLDEIVRSAAQIDTFASQFLNRRSLERVGAKLTLAPVPLNALLERAVTRARLPADKKRLRLMLDQPPSTAVAADELLLDRALANLLDNAMKYSPCDAAVTVRVTADAADSGRVRITVTDAGPGCSPEEQTRLFLPYMRLNKTTTGGEPSTGLGLSLVKQWIDAMGGAVGCESNPGQGSTFWLSLLRA
jgi:two-component system sensor histidine kinase/response regulator